MRRETAIEPTAGSAPEFSKIEPLGPVRSPAAHEQSSCSSPTRPSSPRKCARHGSHPDGHAGAIARMHSTQAPREMPQKRTPRRRCARNYLNASTCSWRCDLVASLPLAQEFSETHRYLCPSKSESGSSRRPLPSQQRPAAKQRGDFGQESSSLPRCCELVAHKRCSPRTSPSPTQPDQNRGVPDAANTRA